MKLRNVFRPHAEGREEMERMADENIAAPASLGPPPPEFTDQVPVVRPDKPLNRCGVCTVVTTLPVCSLCVSRGYAPAVDPEAEIDKVAQPYDQAGETAETEIDQFMADLAAGVFKPPPPTQVQIENGWRYPQ